MTGQHGPEFTRLDAQAQHGYLEKWLYEAVVFFPSDRRPGCYFRLKFNLQLPVEFFVARPQEGEKVWMTAWDEFRAA